MKTKGDFTLMTRKEFKNWIMAMKINRKVTMIQNHHTWLPSYDNFNGFNHFAKLEGMDFSHRNVNGWDFIGQHVTTFSDGMIGVGGRPFERQPAGIRGNNKGAICLEHLGDFDKGQDEMTAEHKKTIVHVNAVLNLKFGLTPNVDTNVYHHWYSLFAPYNRLTDGQNNKRSTKSCPGSNFFGGNTIAVAKKKFIPLIKKTLKEFPEYKTVFGKEAEQPIGHAIVVRANALNVRTGPSVRRKWAGTIRKSTQVAIYEKKGRWSRISTEQRWVSSYYLKQVFVGTVIDPDPKGLSVRSGPNRRFRKLGVKMKGDPITVYEISDNNWYRIDFLDKWVSGKYCTLDG